MRAHAMLMLVGMMIALLIDNHFFLAACVSYSFANFYLQYYYIKKSIHFIFEAANLVSTARWIAMFFVLAYYPLMTNLEIGVVSIWVLLADGLDGYLARKYKTESDFGAYLDMETDAFFVLTLTFIMYQLAMFGWWVLLIGLLRYGYFLVIIYIKPAEQKERRVFRARLIAVILMGSLIGCFVLSSAIYQPLFVVASVLVVYSFGDGFWDLISNYLKRKK